MEPPSYGYFFLGWYACTLALPRQVAVPNTLALLGENRARATHSETPGRFSLQSLDYNNDNVGGSSRCFVRATIACAPDYALVKYYRAREPWVCLLHVVQRLQQHLRRCMALHCSRGCPQLLGRQGERLASSLLGACEVRLCARAVCSWGGFLEHHRLHRFSTVK